MYSELFRVFPLAKSWSKRCLKILFMLSSSIRSPKGFVCCFCIRICNELVTAVNWCANNRIVLQWFRGTGAPVECCLNILKIHNALVFLGFAQAIARVIHRTTSWLFDGILKGLLRVRHRKKNYRFEESSPTEITD